MKNILITGSTDGIGKLTATHLAKEGHCVLIHGRSQAKLDATINEIKDATGNTNITGFLADFSDLADVKHMAQQVLGAVDHLDVLINNAGIFKTSEMMNKDGVDLRFVVNYLAAYLLTEQLLPLLEKADAARVINLSSAAQAPLTFDALLGQRVISLNESYAQSKLALTMWNTHLAKIHQGLTVIAVNPGSLLNTKMANEAYGQYWAPATKGSDILYELAMGASHAAKSGSYYDNDKGGYTPAHRDAAIDQLIEFTKQQLV